LLNLNLNLSQADRQLWVVDATDQMMTMPPTPCFLAVHDSGSNRPEAVYWDAPTKRVDSMDIRMTVFADTMADISPAHQIVSNQR
jgi:hypothetical protein